MAERPYPRLLTRRLTQALQDTPAVLIQGPRQCGKSTLALQIGESAGYAYVTFDDQVSLNAANSDPVGFVYDLPRKVILDEVQRVPALFTAIKSAIDRDRAPGRFILTGSANVMLVPRLADSLAGRIEILRLHPLAQVELSRATPGFVNALFSGVFPSRAWNRSGRDLAERIAAGGFPVALAREARHRRAAWYRDYIDTLVQRDVRDMARISALDALPRLLQFAAGQTARLLNVSDLAAPFQLSRPTIRDYLTLLERVFILEQLPAWHSNRLSRLIKTPKLHLVDTGIAAVLNGLDVEALVQDRPAFGQMLESFVFQELRRETGAMDEIFSFFHFRDKDGTEVDIVIERGNAVAGVEVKAAATVNSSDFRGLRKLQAALGKRFAGGTVLYDGETSARFGDRMYAVPIRALWEL